MLSKEWLYYINIWWKKWQFICILLHQEGIRYICIQSQCHFMRMVSDRKMIPYPLGWERMKVKMVQISSHEFKDVLYRYQCLSFFKWICFSIGFLWRCYMALRPPYPVNKAYQLPSIQCCFIAICVCIKPSQTHGHISGWSPLQSLQEMESCPVFFEQSATPSVPLSVTNLFHGAQGFWY